MVTEQVRGDPRHVTRPKHQSLSRGPSLPVSDGAQDDQLAKDLREHVTQRRELRVLPQTLGSSYTSRKISERRGFGKHDEIRTTGHRCLLQRQTETGDGGVTGVEFTRVMPVRLPGQLDNFDAENVSKLPEHAHPVQRQTPGFNLGDPAHGTIHSGCQLRLIPADAASCPRNALPGSQVSSHHGPPFDTSKVPTR